MFNMIQVKKKTEQSAITLEMFGVKKAETLMTAKQSVVQILLLQLNVKNVIADLKNNV